MDVGIRLGISLLKIGLASLTKPLAPLRLPGNARDVSDEERLQLRLPGLLAHAALVQFALHRS